MKKTLEYEKLGRDTSNDPVLEEITRECSRLEDDYLRRERYLAVIGSLDDRLNGYEKAAGRRIEKRKRSLLKKRRGRRRKAMKEIAKYRMEESKRRQVIDDYAEKAKKDEIEGFTRYLKTEFPANEVEIDRHMEGACDVEHFDPYSAGLRDLHRRMTLDSIDDINDAQRGILSSYLTELGELEKTLSEKKQALEIEYGLKEVRIFPQSGGRVAAGLGYAGAAFLLGAIGKLPGFVLGMGVLMLGVYGVQKLGNAIEKANRAGNHQADYERDAKALREQKMDALIEAENGEI